jgi:hypothetical protein
MATDGRCRCAQNVPPAAGGELQKLVKPQPGLSVALYEQISVNGTGAFEAGSLEDHNGLSGKVFFKTDRAGALHARPLVTFSGNDVPRNRLRNCFSLTRYLMRANFQVLSVKVVSTSRLRAEKTLLFPCEKCPRTSF